MPVTIVEEAPEAPRPVRVDIGGVRGGPPLATVLRKDRWWVQPLIIVLGLLAFIGYATWAAFRDGNFYAGNVGRDYLSPFYSPCLTNACNTNGYVWGGWSWWRISPALLILIFPLAFRMSCYYYRKSYYRSFWLSPPACAVPEPHKRYTGESRFPLIIQNIHRYSWYFAIPLPIILGWEAFKSLQFQPVVNGVLANNAHPGWGLSLGSIVLFVNAFLLASYTASCHSCRHICGGHLNAFSKGPARYWLWRQVTKLNSHHMGLAWISLVFVALTDLYVRLVASGTFVDPKLF